MSPKFAWPSRADREEIGRLLFVSDEPTVCDVGIVFGCSDVRLMKMRAKRAAELFHQGILPKLILCGGLGPPSEASIMADLVNEADVPLKFVMLDESSRTTFENLHNARELLRQNDLVFRTIGLVSCDWHMRRCLEIATYFFGSKMKIFCQPQRDDCLADNWWQSEEGCIRILKELRLLMRLSSSIGCLPDFASIEWYRRCHF